MCKFILSLSIVLVCASLAGAEGHFSFAEIDLSFTPQQMAARGIDLWRHDKAGFGSQSSSVRSSIKFGNDDDIEIEYSPIDYAQISHTAFVGIRGYALGHYMDKKTLALIDNRKLIERIFSLSTEDIVTAESNFYNLALYYQQHNDKYKLSIDQVGFYNKQPDASIQITYLTIPGFKQRPLYLHAWGNALKYVPEVFNQRYGKSSGLNDDSGLRVCWENDKEIAISSSGGAELMILDKELYKAMVRFVAPEARRIAAEQQSKAKAEEEAKKGGI